jgi:hypothetical protein
VTGCAGDHRKRRFEGDSVISKSDSDPPVARVRNGKTRTSWVGDLQIAMDRPSVGQRGRFRKNDAGRDLPRLSLAGRRRGRAPCTHEYGNNRRGLKPAAIAPSRTHPARHVTRISDACRPRKRGHNATVVYPLRGTVSVCRSAMVLLAKCVAQVRVDQLAHALAHVADERLVGAWFVDEQNPAKVRAVRTCLR